MAVEAKLIQAYISQLEKDFKDAKMAEVLLRAQLNLANERLLEYDEAKKAATVPEPGQSDQAEKSGSPKRPRP